MGSWSVDILGGDTPLDYLDEISEKIGVKSLYVNKDESVESVRAKLEQLIPEIDAETIFDSDSYEHWIGYQVLAVKLLEYGVILSDKTKEVLISHIEQDDWDEIERVEKVNELIESVKNHGTEPTKVKSRGLFEVLAEATKPEGLK